MKLLLDSFWRAAAYLMMPRVVGLSLLPLLIAGGLSLGLGYFYWEAAVAGVRATLESWSLVESVLIWIDGVASPSFRTVLAPLIVVALAVPVIVVLSLLLVALLMVPAIVSLVAERRFGTLERRRGGAMWQGLLWSLGCTLVALVAMFVTMPLWLIPPLVLIIPPLIWGWLTTKVMSFDVLAEHASKDERHALLKDHGWQMLLIGIVTGYLGAAPSLLWAVSAATLIFAPLLIAVSVWLYTLVFAFSALWFAHYALAALKALRIAKEGELLPPLGSVLAPAQPASVVPPAPAPAPATRYGDSDAPPILPPG
ncbi:MAG TPA: EI24 domain-containing protein [Ideonella sp.]|nr:EI24 domain-containing protein [Ideonella sp.]